MTWWLCSECLSQKKSGPPVPWANHPDNDICTGVCGKHWQACFLRVKGGGKGQQNGQQQQNQQRQQPQQRTLDPFVQAAKGKGAQKGGGKAQQNGKSQQHRHGGADKSNALMAKSLSEMAAAVASLRPNGAPPPAAAGATQAPTVAPWAASSPTQSAASANQSPPQDAAKGNGKGGGGKSLGKTSKAPDGSGHKSAKAPPADQVKPEDGDSVIPFRAEVFRKTKNGKR